MNTASNEPSHELSPQVLIDELLELAKTTLPPELLLDTLDAKLLAAALGFADSACTALARGETETYERHTPLALAAISSVFESLRRQVAVDLAEKSHYPALAFRDRACGEIIEAVNYLLVDDPKEARGQINRACKGIKSVLVDIATERWTS